MPIRLFSSSRPSEGEKRRSVNPASWSARQKRLPGRAKCSPTAPDQRLGLIPTKSTSSPGAITSGMLLPRAARSSAGVGREFRLSVDHGRRLSDVNVETFVYAFIFGAVIWLFARRFGVKPSPWREALAGVLLYVALSLGLMASGVGVTESVTIAVIGSGLLVWGWKRFVHRTA